MAGRVQRNLHMPRKLARNADKVLLTTLRGVAKRLANTMSCPVFLEMCVVCCREALLSPALRLKANFVLQTVRGWRKHSSAIRTMIGAVSMAKNVRLTQIFQACRAPTIARREIDKEKKVLQTKCHWP